MRCEKCGTEFNSGKFCPQCGTELKKCSEEMDKNEDGKKLPIKEVKSKKGSLSKIILVVLVCVFLSKCGEEDMNTDFASEEETQNVSSGDINDLPIYSMDYLLAYIGEFDIDIPKSLNKKEIEKALKCDSDPVNVKVSNGGQYTVTNEDSVYQYIGETKNNLPHGIGRIIKWMSAAEYNDENGTHVEFDEFYLAEDTSQVVAVLVYAGEFEKGYYDGYGWEFIVPFEGVAELWDSAYQRDLGYDYYPVSDDLVESVLATCNPVGYMGEFKKGTYDGEGVMLQYAIREIPPEFDVDSIIEAFGYRADREVQITVGEFKDGMSDGEVTEYLCGKVLYEGEMSDGFRDGEGTSYFLGTDQIKYTGEWKDGQYHGKGTLYDEKGERIYKGKWENGDYAN